MNGDLADLGVADLLYLLALRHQTGRLSVVTSRILAHLYLDTGRLVLATAADPALRLGQLLLAAGAITADKLAEALAEQARSPEPEALGLLLIERGLVTPDVIDRALHAQIVGVLVRVLTSATGLFLFERDVRVPPNLPIPNIDTDLLILASVRAVSDTGQTLPEAAIAEALGECQPVRQSRRGRPRHPGSTTVAGDAPGPRLVPAEQTPIAKGERHWLFRGALARS